MEPETPDPSAWPDPFAQNEETVADDQLRLIYTCCHPVLSPDASVSPLEAHLKQGHRRPVAVAGVVENGLVRPLDPAVHLPEHARVIIVAAEEV